MELETQAVGVGEDVPQRGVAIDGLGDRGERVAVDHGVARRGGGRAVAGGVDREIVLVEIRRRRARGGVGLERAGSRVDGGLVDELVDEVHPGRVFIKIET